MLQIVNDDFEYIECGISTLSEQNIALYESCQMFWLCVVTLSTIRYACFFVNNGTLMNILSKQSTWAEH